MNYQPRKILLVGEMQRETAMNLLRNAPIDPIKPLEFILRPEVKMRKPAQNALMWTSAIKDIAEQAWIDGRQYNEKVWHIHFKEDFLPEQHDPVLTKEGYVKWDYLPNGERRLIGSTTQLTVKGFALYMDQVYALGGSLGVQFRANPNE